MNRSYFLSVISLVLLLVSCRTGYFNETIPGNDLPSPVDMMQLRQAGTATFARYGFVVESEEAGRIVARKGTEAHNVMLLVELVYARDGYKINYLDDNGFEINRSKNSAHPNFAVWMIRLRDGVSEYYRNPAAAVRILDGAPENREAPAEMAGKAAETVVFSTVSTASYRHGLETMTWTGFDWFVNSRGEVYITDLATGSPAFGMLGRNDRILLMQGQTVSSSEDIYRILLDMYPGQTLEVSYSRDGVQGSVSYESGSVQIPNYLKSLSGLCAEGQSLRLAVLVGGSDELDAGVRHEQQSQEEFLVLEHMDKFESFRLIDRSRVEELQDEQNFGLTGLVEESVQLGKLLGASHILDVFLNSSGGTITERLIDVQSGEVVASAVRDYQGQRL